MADAATPALTTLSGPLLLVLSIAIPMAFVTSLLLLALYLRAVVRSMRRTSGYEAHASAQPADPAHGKPPSQPLTIAAHALDMQPRASLRPLWRAAAIQIAAGLAFAMVMALVYLRANAFPFDWLMGLFLTLYYAWPIVIAVALVAALSWTATAAIVAGYAVLLVCVAIPAIAGTGITAQQLAEVWMNGNAEGTLLTLLFLARPIRAVGPMVAAFMIAATGGAISLALATGNSAAMLEAAALIGTKLGLGAYSAPAALLATGALLAALVGWMALRLLGKAYRRGYVTDQSILVDSVWLMFAVQYGVSLAINKPTVWALAAVVALLAYKAVSGLAFKLMMPGSRNEPDAPRLLLLRVFSLGPRSGHLYAGLEKLWRHTGSISMIAGPDLAKTTIEPHEFLDFAGGHLQRAFIPRAADLQSRLEETVPQRGWDGRFQVTSFFCHDDTWKMSLEHLAADSSAVLMDLRGFGAQNRGCIYEIEELLERVALNRIVFLADGSTDETLLADTLMRGWAKTRSGSANWADLTPRVNIYWVEGRPAISKLAGVLKSASGVPLC